MVSKRFRTLAIERAGRSKHDGGVQVGNDAGHSTGRCDAGLGATVPGLECSQHMRDLGEGRHMVTAVGYWEKAQRRGLGKASPQFAWMSAVTFSETLRAHSMSSFLV